MNETTSTTMPSSNNTLWYVLGGIAVLLVIGGIVANSMGFFAMRAAGVDVDQNVDGTQTYTTNEGSVTVGQGASMPANWPSDVPEAYSGATIVYSGTSNPQTGAAGSAVMYNTTASMQSVIEYYTARLKAEGWTIEATANMSGTQVITAKKDTRTFGAYIIDAGNGTVSVTAGIEL